MQRVILRRDTTYPLARARLHAALPALRSARPVPVLAATQTRLPRLRPALERPEEGYYLGAWLVNLVIAEILPLAAIVAVLLATLPHPPWNLLLYGGGALAVASPFAFYPFSKLLWLALDQFIQPTMDSVGKPPPRETDSESSR